jgi:tetratricopeptide (TPR) repeat protein
MDEKASPTADIQELMTRGNGCLNAADPGEAITCFTSALQLSPRNPRIYRQRAKAYVKKSEHMKAIADLEIAIGLAPRDPDSVFLRGRVWHLLRNDKKAIVDLLQRSPTEARSSPSGALPCDPPGGDVGAACNDRLSGCGVEVRLDHILEAAAPIPCGGIRLSNDLLCSAVIAGQCRINGDRGCALCFRHLAALVLPDVAGLFRGSYSRDRVILVEVPRPSRDR